MSLAEQLKKKAVATSNVKVDGMEFVVTGKSKADRSKLMATHRKKDGKLDGDKFDSAALESCVSMADGSTLTASEWDGIPSHITGPLMSEVMKVCGFDNDDIERSPKACDSTGS
jgi:hypothetical protein